MRRCGRILKWAGLILCVSLAVGWIVSIRFLIRYDSKSVEFMVYSGCVQFTTPNLLKTRGWAIRRKSFNELLLWGEVSNITAAGRVVRSVRIPLWIPFVPAVVVTVLLWRRMHLSATARCQNCGYNLPGNTSGVCPECGQPIG